MTLRIEDAAIDRFTQVNLTARTGERGADLELSAASGWWQRLSVEGRVEYADLSARARVELDALRVDADIPASRVRAQLRTDAKSVIECDFEASVGSVGSAKGKLLLPANQLVAQLDALDLAQALDIARRRVPHLDAIESAEGKLSASVDARIGPPWQARIDVNKSNAAVKLAALP